MRDIGVIAENVGVDAERWKQGTFHGTWKGAFGTKAG